MAAPPARAAPVTQRRRLDRIGTVLSAIVSVSVAVFCGRGGVAPPLLDAVYGVHVYLHVLASLEGLAADGAGVRQVARRVHVEDVLLEVAIVAVALAALGAGGLGGRLTVSVAGAGAVGRELLGGRRVPLAGPAASCRRTVSFSARTDLAIWPYHFPVTIVHHDSSYDTDFLGASTYYRNGIIE